MAESAAIVITCEGITAKYAARYGGTRTYTQLGTGILEGTTENAVRYRGTRG